MKREFRLISLILAIFTGLSLFSSCSKDESITPSGSIDERGTWGATATTDAQASSKPTFYGLTSTNELIGYDINPLKEVSATTLTGMIDREQMMAIDFSATSGVLYGISNKGLLYTIDPVTGKSAAVSYEPIATVNSSTVGLDFNNRTGQLQVMTSDGQNLKVDPATGKVVGAEFSATPPSYTVNGIAYTNNFNSSTVGSMFAIDSKGGTLYKSSSTFSSFQPVGSLGLTTSGEGGFDINRDNSMALAVLYGHSTTPVFSATDDLSQDKYRLYNISLRTGQATYMDAMTRDVVGIAMTY